MHREILIFSSLCQPISALHRALYLHIAFFIHTINLYIKTTTANKLPQKRIKRNKLDEVVKIIAKYVKTPEADIRLGLPYVDKNGVLMEIGRAHV